MSKESSSDMSQLNKKEPMVHVNMRLPKYVVEHFKKFEQPTVAMRKALEDEVERQQEGEP